jgi:2,3-bisphosphoglycerate-independent phosphoglycerate mutase
MGNSEVGHLSIGAGRKVLQDLPRINAAIADGNIGRSPAMLAVIERLRRTGGAIVSGKYDLIVLNYANPDMVGHTDNLSAAIKAVEAVDTGLGRLADAIRKVEGALLITADHGNCEKMRDPETGEPHTAHTTNPVPVLLMDGGAVALTDGLPADIAPTLLELLSLPKPAEMTCTSLLRPHAAGEAR